MRGNSIKHFLTLGAIVAASVLAGCGEGGESTGGKSEGGGDAETTVTASSHSKAEFLKLANAICDRGREVALGRIGAYMRAHEGAEKENRAENEELFVKAVQAELPPEIESQVEEIRALGAPSGDEKRIEALLAALEEAANAHRNVALRSQVTLTKDFERSAGLAKAYGLESCAYEG